MLGTIPKELLSKIKKASEDDSALFPLRVLPFLMLGIAPLCHCVSFSKCRS